MACHGPLLRSLAETRSASLHAYCCRISIVNVYGEIYALLFTAEYLSQQINQMHRRFLNRNHQKCSVIQSPLQLNTRWASQNFQATQ